MSAGSAVPAANGNVRRRPDPAETYDVALLGAHLATGLLGAILAGQGLRVLLVRSAADADELSGETTVPYTAEVFLLLARRFGVPEIAEFARFADLPLPVRRSSGVKRSLGFLYHRRGARQDPQESVQFNVPGEHTEWHPYRPDVDRYAVQLAERYGAAVAEPGVEVADAWVESHSGRPEGRIRATDGNDYRARFIVDCVGAASPLVRRAGGDDAEPRLRHRARVLSARMSGVSRTEDVFDTSRYSGASAWSGGTVHHLFDGGWLQLADFGNHGQSDNDTVGVTLSVSPYAFGDLPDDPDQAFRAVLARFPDLGKQFRAAKAEAWRGETLVQRTAVRTHGPGWFAMERSAGRNDLLLARDVTMTAEIVHAVAGALIPAALDGDFADERFARIAEFQRELGAFHDLWLDGARTASADFALLNAFSRVWLLWQILADLSLKRARLDCRAAADGDGAGRADWSPVERFDLGGIWFPVPAGLREVIDHTMGTLARVRSGTLTPRSAADELFALLRREPFVPPLYAFGDPDARIYRFTFRKRLQMLWWVKTKAPHDFRRLLTRDNVTSVSSRSVR
ncbi:hypothetical protein [Actinomadura meridiana]|uniref:NAD(P)/FAD-dependent oxidoreductase n=1 Tax=Actinomadura meridiana TaxID=559626 RepID=UPI0031E81EC1